MTSYNDDETTVGGKTLAQWKRHEEGKNVAESKTSIVTGKHGIIKTIYTSQIVFGPHVVTREESGGVQPSASLLKIEPSNYINGAVYLQVTPGHYTLNDVDTLIEMLGELRSKLPHYRGT